MGRPGAAWNPKRLGVQTSIGAPRQHETEVWLYLVGRKLDIVIQVNEAGRSKGQTIHTVTLPRALSRR